MTVLDAGRTSGIGGLTIWNKQQSVSAFSAISPRDARVLASGPIRTTISLNGPQATQLISIYAHGQYLENHVRIPASKASTRIGPGFTKLPNDKMFFNSKEGYFGAWGRQNDIVQEIGMAAIFPVGTASLQEDKHERHIVFNAKAGMELTYYTVGDWRRGRTFPVAPTVLNWEKETRALARRLRSPSKTVIGPVERRSAIVH
jgi:hypothetical protein